MKKAITIVLLFVSTISLAQTNRGTGNKNKPNYSESSEIAVIYNDSLEKFGHGKKQKSAAIFVNGKFIGDQSTSDVINPKKIDSIKVEKYDFKKNGKEFDGKILVEMNPDYRPNYMTLDEIATKYLELNANPIIYQIDKNVIDIDSSEYLVDESFILKIILDEINTTERGTKVNLVKLITKTPENIKEANKIMIRGTKI
ncbi:hypothetical protein DHD05_22140 [Arenibacter sp. N53]|uniref:hypothetical protein n=1 Tax=Arenibacter TaxID=178469 RepID=UPI000CD3C916|nr:MULTISPECIES: hypothetical protein [Arenibacter]MCM4154295.1 hypothetical protein [Arenibacter sp. N53]